MSEQAKPEEKQASVDEGRMRLRAFEVGIGKFCNEANLDYADFAKRAGSAPEQFGANLVDALVSAAEKQAAAGK